MNHAEVPIMPCSDFTAKKIGVDFCGGVVAWYDAMQSAAKEFFGRRIEPLYLLPSFMRNPEPGLALQYLANDIITYALFEGEPGPLNRPPFREEYAHLLERAWHFVPEEDFCPAIGELLQHLRREADLYVLADQQRKTLVYDWLSEHDFLCPIRDLEDLDGLDLLITADDARALSTNTISFVVTQPGLHHSDHPWEKHRENPRYLEISYHTSFEVILPYVQTRSFMC